MLELELTTLLESVRAGKVRTLSMTATYDDGEVWHVTSGTRGIQKQRDNILSDRSIEEVLEAGS